MGFGACSLHGGNTSSGKKHAAKLEAAHLRAQFMVSPDPVSPEQALQEVLAATFALFKELRRQLAEAGSIEAVPARVLEMFGAESDRLERLAKTHGGLKIAERQVRLNEMQGELMYRVFVAAIGDPSLGLAPEQRMRAQQVIRRELGRATAAIEPPRPGGLEPDVVEAEVLDM